MYCRTGLGIVLFLATASCSRPIQAEIQRFAILRFEDLSADSSADWMGRALSEVLSAELSGAPSLTVVSGAQLHTFDRTLGVRPISAPGISTELTEALAAGANRVGLGDYSVRAGRLTARITLEDSHTGRMVKVISASTAANDVFGAANDLARQISDRLAPYPTHNPDCLKAYIEALESRDTSDTAANLERAIAADPDFGPPYRLLAELDAQRGDRAAAQALIDRAKSRGDAIAPVERARIGIVAADLHADVPAKLAALATLAKLEPGDINTWQTLAQLTLTRHEYKQSEDAYQHALRIQPENPTLLNEVAYAAGYAGDFSAGFAALRRYRQLRPNDPNEIDSEGDLNLLAGHLREAEELYLQANKKDPNFLPGGAGGDLFKAAMARAMTGDIAGADGLDKQFTDARVAAHDANASFQSLEWLWLTGRRKQAYAELRSSAQASEHGSQPLVASHAYAELAIWSLISGDRATAAAMSQKAAALANQATAAPAVIARFLAQPSAPAAEWQSRAERFVPNPAQSGIRDQMLAYALLLDGKVKDAAAPLQRIYATSGLSLNDEGLPVLLAWTHLESGDADAAAQLLKLNPVPPPGGVATFMPLYFPKIFELRSQVAAKAGKPDDAKQNLDLFHKLSGK